MGKFLRPSLQSIEWIVKPIQRRLIKQAVREGATICPHPGLQRKRAAAAIEPLEPAEPGPISQYAPSQPAGRRRSDIIIISLFRMVPIQRQRRRGLHTHTDHQVSYVFNNFRKSVLRQSTVTDNIGQIMFQTRGAAAAKERSPKDVFILTTSSI